MQRTGIQKGSAWAFSISSFKSSYKLRCSSLLEDKRWQKEKSWSVFPIFFPLREYSGNFFLQGNIRSGQYVYPSPQTWLSTRSFEFWEMDLLRLGSLLSFPEVASGLARSVNRNGTDVGKERDAELGEGQSFLWVPLGPEQNPRAFSEDTLCITWAVLQPTP